MKLFGFFAGTLIFAGTQASTRCSQRAFHLPYSDQDLDLFSVGRAGAVLGPLVPGLLFSAGLELHVVALLMSSGAFIAGVVVVRLQNKQEAGAHAKQDVRLAQP